MTNYLLTKCEDCINLFKDMKEVFLWEKEKYGEKTQVSSQLLLAINFSNLLNKAKILASILLLKKFY